MLFYIAFNSQGHFATGSLQVEETSAYCTVNHRASASNNQLSNMKRKAQDSNRRPQTLEARTLTTTPPSPHQWGWQVMNVGLKVHTLHGFTCIKVPDSTHYVNIRRCTVYARPNGGISFGSTWDHKTRYYIKKFELAWRHTTHVKFSLTWSN